MVLGFAGLQLRNPDPGVMMGAAANFFGKMKDHQAKMKQLEINKASVTAESLDQGMRPKYDENGNFQQMVILGRDELPPGPRMQYNIAEWVNQEMGLGGDREETGFGFNPNPGILGRFPGAGGGLSPYLMNSGLDLMSIFRGKFKGAPPAGP